MSLLNNTNVMIVPLGSDVSQKRLAVWKKCLERMGAQVYTASGTCMQSNGIIAELINEQYPRSIPSQNSNLYDAQEKRRAKRKRACSSSTAAIDWNAIDVIVVSKEVTKDRLLAYCNLPDIPVKIRCLAPEWIAFLAREGRHPRVDELQHYELIWPGGDVSGISTNADPSLKGVDFPESRSDDSEAEHGSKESEKETPASKNTDSQACQKLVDELQLRKLKLVEERKKIFLENNPSFVVVSPRSDMNDSLNNTENFVCQTSSLMQENLNSHLTEPLEELMEYLHVEGDTWREYSYKKVVSSLKILRYRVSHVKDLKGLWWAKGRLRDRVTELLETGTMTKLEAKRQDSRCIALRDFGRIWGVGPSTAAKLYKSGFRNMSQLRETGLSHLSDQQQIGLKHYDDFLKKIPRDEVMKIEEVVVNEVHRISPQAKAIACGSFRRGKSACGDCDIIITDPNDEECAILPGLIKRLHVIEFLTDDLTQVSEHRIGRCASYMGVCRLDKYLPYRRIDIKVYPRRYYGCALLYFTGSDHFNRSMRLYARKHGWSLSDRELKPLTAQARQQMGCADTLLCFSEMDVFIALGLEYKDPLERNCFDIRFLHEDPNGVEHEEKD